MNALETEVRLSESLIWQKLEDYYASAGLSAWPQVPYYITTNPVIAEAYAELIVAFLLDYQAHLNPDAPVYLLELGAGTGVLSPLLVKEILAKKAYFEALAPLQICYLMTDFTSTIVEGWRENSRIADLCAQGVMDLAVYRPETDDSLYLAVSGKTLKAGDFENPVIVIANYLFDSLRHDLFRTVDGVLQECRVSYHEEASPPDQESPPFFARLKKTEHCHPIDAASYYDDARWNAVLSWYQTHMPSASIIFPVGGMRCLSMLETLTGNHFVMLSSDKGFARNDFMVGQWEYTYTTNGGAFSWMVNYHAMRVFLEAQQGGMFYTTDQGLDIMTTFSYRLRHPECLLEATRYYFQEKIVKQNLINHLHGIQHFLEAEKHERPDLMMKASLSLLHISNYDPGSFIACADKIMKNLRGISYAHEEILLWMLPKIRAHMIIQNESILNCMGMIYYGLKDFDKARDCFETVVATFGPSYFPLFYLADCHKTNKDFAKALEYFEQALTFRPDCELTQGVIQGLKTLVSLQPSSQKSE